MIKRPIAISLSPNTKIDDVVLALKMMLKPWLHYSGGHVKLLELWFRQFFTLSYAVSFNSGRSALLAVLKAIGVNKKDEVLLQAFTCVAVPNAIIALGARPIYCDVEDSLTINPKDVEKKITENTKAIIVQHTFGIPADLTELKRISRKHNITLIEDCAHVVGGEYKKQKLGTIGDAAIFSFGRDKAFSSIFGGIVITGSEELGKKLRSIQRDLNNPSIMWVYQQLLHPIIFSIILPIYDLFSLGKIILVVLQKLKFLSFPVSSEEKKGLVFQDSFKKMPNSLACLALMQLKKISSYNHKRETISSMYINNLVDITYELPCSKVIPYLRFPLLVDHRDACSRFLRNHGVYAGNWYSNVIDPIGVDFKRIFYQRGSCPNAERFANKIINLPTYPTMKLSDAEKVVNILIQYVKDRRDKK